MKANVSYLALDALLAEAGTAPANRLDQMAADWPADEALLLHLVDFAGQADPDSQVAATGLLKRYQAAGAAFPSPVVARLFDLFATVSRWEARLHLLQMFPALPVVHEQAGDLREFLQDCLATERNRFVRAWAFGGLHRLAELWPEYRPEVRVRLERAMHEEAPAVRARLRHLASLAQSERPDAD